MIKTVNEISDEELNALAEAINKRYGIDFTNYEPKSLKRGFARLMMKNKMTSILDLWSRIMADRAFFTQCIDGLTVNLTELFRNPDFWKKLKDDILEQKKIKSKLNIWHAGCSSGEEVYTTAILLERMNMLRRTKSLATDLSLTILDKAKNGEYSNILIDKYNSTFQKVFPFEKLNRSFEYGERSAIIKPELKKHIEFKQHNLVHEGMNSTFDIIFCRNVMIYFDDFLKMKVLNLFYNSLKDDGFFIIGYYDMLPTESKNLFSVYDAKTRIYKKVLK